MRIPGILGGMGPQATVALMQRIHDLTPAACDADHLPLIVVSDPRIPDRTEAIRGRGPSPLPAMIEAGRRLEAAGADFIAIPCNTAHHYLAGLRAALRLPVLDLIAETAGAAVAQTPEGAGIGILATDGTLDTGLYRDALSTLGRLEIRPECDEQRTRVMEAVYGKSGIKAGRITPEQAALLADAVRSLHRRGAAAVIAGCTEIPLALEAFPFDFPIPVLSSINALAQAVLREAAAEARGSPRAEHEVA